MSPFERLESLFSTAAELPPEERDAFLERELPDAPEERAELRALLESDTRGSPFLDAGIAPPAADARPEELEGLELPGLRLLEHLRSGGMGHVYRALATRGGVERKVAVKVLKRGLDTEALLRRFRRERRVLARLHHPSIVSFEDAGALPDGRPYLAMELVEGEHLGDAAARLPARERLVLLRKVVKAVEAAHQRGIVHGDLKPSNVLVTANGEPKLLDFGLAQLLTREDEEEHTELGSPAALTLAYASPERRRGEPADVSSDVYSLGLMLRELQPDARGDLALLIATATASDRERRYPSAEALGADVDRFLASQPLAARPATIGYVTRRFVARNRGRVLVAAALLAALVTGWASAELRRRDASRDARRGWGAHAEAVYAVRELERRWVASLHGEVAEAAFSPDLASFSPPQVDSCPETRVLLHLALAAVCVERGELDTAHRHLEQVRDGEFAPQNLSRVLRERLEELERITAR